MSVTPNHNLPLLQAGQSGAFVHLNEAATVIEFASHHGMDDSVIPPGSPSFGDAYMILGTGTGAWAGHDQEVAVWLGKWVFFTKPFGDLYYDVSVVKLFARGSSSYVHARTSTGTIAPSGVVPSNPTTKAEVEQLQTHLNGILLQLRGDEIIAVS